MLVMLVMLIVVGCSDARPKPPATTTTDAAVTRTPSPDADVATTMSWIGVRLDGLTINEVLENTPAKRAGVAAGDQLVSLYGEPVESVRVFIDQIAGWSHRAASARCDHPAHGLAWRDGGEADDHGRAASRGAAVTVRV